MNYDIKARIRLFKTVDGGRSGPTPSNYLGLPFLINGEAHDARILLDEYGSLKPGDEALLPIVFLNKQDVLKKINKGDKLLLWEGKIIGEAIVEEL